VNRISASDSSLGEEDAAKRAKAFTNQTQGLLSAVTSMGLLHIIDASASNVTAQAIAVVKGGTAAAALPTQLVADVPMFTGTSARCPPKCIFVLGGPGSGKGASQLAPSSTSTLSCRPLPGHPPEVMWLLARCCSFHLSGTQCAKLVESFGCLHLSAGDLLRKEVLTGSKHGLAIADMIKEGKIVPAQVTIDLLKAAMSMAQDGTMVLIDGFPRSMENLEAFEEQVGECALTLLFDVPPEVMEKRLSQRGKTSGRTDDSGEIITKRVQTFISQSVPVVAALREKSKVVDVDAAGSVEEVAVAISAEVRKIM